MPPCERPFWSEKLHGEWNVWANQKDILKFIYICHPKSRFRTGILIISQISSRVGEKKYSYILIFFTKKKIQLELCKEVFPSPHWKMDVSENSGTPKSSNLIGFSIINYPFWGTPIFGNTHIGRSPPFFGHWKSVFFFSTTGHRSGLEEFLLNLSHLAEVPPRTNWGKGSSLMSRFFRWVVVQPPTRWIFWDANENGII